MHTQDNRTDHAEQIATAVLGDPSSRTRRQLRYGTHGSLALDIAGPKAGLFFDFETGEGGDVIDLVKRECGVGFVEARTFCEQITGGIIPLNRATPAPRPVDDGEEKRKGWALNTWKQTEPIGGTPGEAYFVNTRKIDLGSIPLDHCLRWHDRKRMIVGLMRSPLTGDPTGIHRTFLKEDGTKLERRMLGSKGVVCLTPFTDVTEGLGITEGIEDGLSLLAIGQAPIWCAMDAGSIATFPLVPGIESLTIFADNDEAGIRGANACQQTWIRAGREARIIYPPGGKS